jgi:2-polyprenyl-6-hydroxyphenyl methylase/3-demethylubiquinone-9 3-methyltransferase
VEDALRRYDCEPVGIRLFVRARHLLAPLGPIADRVSPEGPVLDVGCGHGLFVNLLALQAPERPVVGVEPSAVKIAVARRSSDSLPNVSYIHGHVHDVPEGGSRTISILDVLYLLPDAEKLALLRECRQRIDPRGTLLLLTNDVRPRWKYALTRVQEEAMTRLGLTLGRGELCFRSAAQNAALLEAAGFRPTLLDVSGRLPYPHKLFIATPV